MVGPDYQKPPVQIPATFKEGTNWQRAQANPQGAMSSTWWLIYQDDTLSHLVQQALTANQSIIGAEAAYRLAKATINASTANLYPTIGAGLSATRSQSSSNAFTGGASGTSNLFQATATVSWEADLWGQIRRQIESSKESAQATDAQLAGERLSIAANPRARLFRVAPGRHRHQLAAASNNRSTPAS